MKKIPSRFISGFSATITVALLIGTFITPLSFAEEINAAESASGSPVPSDATPIDATEIKNAGTSEIPQKLSIPESLALANARNIDLQRALESVEKQKARVVEIRGGMLPEFSANAGASWLDEGRRFSFQGGQKPNSTTWQGNIQMDQAIFKGGKNLAALAGEDYLLEAIQYQYENIKNQVAFEVYQAYYKVLLDRELLKVREEAVSLLQDELGRAQKKFAVGSVSNFDVIRAQVALANAKTPLIRAQNSVSLSLEDLKRVLNIDLDREVLAGRITDSLVHTWDTYPLEEAVRRAKEGNPELQRLEKVKKASERGIDFQRADFLPALSLSVNYGVERTAFVPTNFEGWQAGVNLKWKLFDSFQTISRVEQAQSQFKDANLALEKARLDNDIEVRRSSASAVEARELVDVATKVVEQAQESFRLSQNRFDVGSATQLDVLADRLALTEARSNSAEALYSHNMAEVQLRRSIGVLGGDLNPPH